MTDRTFLHQVTKPGRYLGNEFNISQTPWRDDQLHCALIFPDIYEIGMSHQGLQILYHILNASGHTAAERCFCPDIDAEQVLRASKLPLTALESGRPLTAFDFLGITLPYELCYGNILTILDLAEIPPFSKDRDDSFPLLIGGGACSLNPEPVADFFDAILLGDGEEAILEIASCLALAKKDGLTKAATLRLLAGIAGVYIPADFLPEYDQSGKLSALMPVDQAQGPVSRRILADLSSADHLLQPIVPNAKIVHDRLGVEIARGCTRGCRFCQAGITYRPVRERSPAQILNLARTGIANSGFEELALLSLSTGDYSCLDEVLPQLMDTFSDDFVSVSMPSMRVGTLTPAIMNQIRRVRKTGFTLAPEAGSERLRRVINKGITEADLLATCRAAFNLGWKVIKLYFMIGLPTETEEDIAEIIKLIKAIRRETDGVGRGKRMINVSIGTFVPKPHTPFQWQAQISIAQSREKITQLTQAMPRGITIKWHIPEQSYLEGVFARGDRRLSGLIHAAWLKGARLDGWSDHFNLGIWRQAAEDCGLDLDQYLRAREMDEILPWQHLHSGVDDDFLRQEFQKGLSEGYTPDCRYHGCQGCGLCDFETIQPIVHGNPAAVGPATDHGGEDDAPLASRHDRREADVATETHSKYMVSYSRIGTIAFLGHLEFLQLIFRSLRRAGISTNFSHGFNPSPKISFGPALPAGTESLAEYFVMDLKEPLADIAATMDLLNSKLPPGVRIHHIAADPGRVPQDIICTYQLTLAEPMSDQAASQAATFLASPHCLVSRERKGKKKEVDIRPLIASCALTGPQQIALEIVYKSGEPGIKPAEAAIQIVGLSPQQALATKVVKTGWRPLPTL